MQTFPVEGFCYILASACFLFLSQLFIYRPELTQRRLQALHNLRRQHLGRRQVIGVFQAFILEPENVQAGLVPLHQLFVAEGLEPLALFPLMPVLWIITLYEVLQIVELERVGLESEVLVSPQVVYPELISLSIERSIKCCYR